MTWYEQWFSRDEYDIVYSDRDDQEAIALVDLIESVIGSESIESILDIGCGRGRHAVEFARRGYRVTGLDLSERALERARTRATDEGLSVDFICGDMRNPVKKSSFDCVVNLFTAFGYFEAWADHQRAVDAMAASVKPGKYVVQDFLNPSHVSAELTALDSTTVGETRIEQRRWIDEGRVLKEIIFSGPKGSHTFFESVALLERADFDRLYECAGLSLVEVRGDYSGGPYSEDSPRMILFSTRL